MESLLSILVLLLILGGAIAGVVAISNRNKRLQAERRARELEPVKKLAFEDVTALGEDLQQLDLDLAGQPMGEGENADYQRALDAYESAKTAADRMEKPDDVRHVTEILEDGRYAMACVRARVAGEELPARRPPCFFDPRHGLSVADVPWTPPGGTERDVPACALDVERVRAGAEPDSRKVLVGSQRMPYYAAGPAYQPYAVGYFGAFGPMEWMFMGMMFGGLGEGIGELGEGIGDALGGLGDSLGDMDFGGFDF